MNSTEELRLIGLGLEIGRAANITEALALVADRLEALLGVSCIVRSQNGSEWLTVASAGTPGAGDQQRATRVPLPQATPPSELILVAHAAGEGGRSTGERSIDALLRDPHWMEALGVVVGNALHLVQLRSQRGEMDRRTESVGDFSRALLGISDSATLHRLILEHMARAVRAEIGALAVYVPHENSLAITSTFGYPAVLVEHVRPSPGEGVLGRVFATGEPMLVANAATLHRPVTRRRYRTDSFVALPLTDSSGVVAVVSLTDKAGGEAFSPADLALLQMMAMPAALAVSRELLRERTNDLAHLATVDALTGLFNRRYFETRLEQELQRQRRQLDDLSLLMLDLDNFKELNDTQGHLVGDLALKEVAEILRRAVRIFDVCARYGGEEFVILMPGAGASTALRIAERIRRQVEQHFSSSLRSGVPVPLTVSIGVSTASPSVTRDGLVNQADTALLQAKETGKNQVHVHTNGGS